MQHVTRQFPPDKGTDYLENLQGLAKELETAMNLIARQEIFPLQESIRLQQAFCSRLAYIQSGRSSMLRCDKGPAETSFDADLDFQIEEAITAVRSLNQRYAALLRHSGETLRLFAGLVRIHRGPPHSAAGLQEDFQTWSCEV